MIAVQQTNPSPSPPPFALPAVLNERNFKLAVMNYARVQGAPAPFETSSLACSLEQYSYSLARLIRLNDYPWTRHILAHGGANILPLAILAIPDHVPVTVL